MSHHATDYANDLLRTLGLSERVDATGDHPALAWRRAGLLRTTGLMLPVPLVSHVDGALMALQALSPDADLPNNAGLLMGERARLRETVREGRFCAGGYGRLLDAQDGRIALNLVREDDWGLIPAWLEADISNWDGISQTAKGRTVDMLVERAAELGLAVSKDGLPKRPNHWFSSQSFEQAPVKSNPLIVDLSGLWAGPLASSLLKMTGMRVIKVESPSRADGMRFGHEGFYKLINAGKDCIALDFRNPEQLNHLKTILDVADIVITASRPRAFPQLGIHAEDFMSNKPGKIWLRLTAYGSDTDRIGFGDDIGISAGLSEVMDKSHGEPCFVGDAIADPVNGVHLAYLIKAFSLQGGGALLDVAMRDVLRYAMGHIPESLSDVARAWQVMADADDMPFYKMRYPKGETKDLGADTDRVLADLC